MIFHQIPLLHLMEGNKSSRLFKEMHKRPPNLSNPATELVITCYFEDLFAT